MSDTFEYHHSDDKEIHFNLLHLYKEQRRSYYSKFQSKYKMTLKEIENFRLTGDKINITEDKLNEYFYFVSFAQPISRIVLFEKKK